MNKTLKGLLLVAIMSISFASCTQVDLLDEVQTKNTARVRIQMDSEYPTTTTIVFATRIVNNYNKSFYRADSVSLKPGQYKFYAINKSSEYEYENLAIGDSVYYADVNIKSMLGEAFGSNQSIKGFSDDGMKKALSGNDYVQVSSHTLFCDTTKVVDVESGKSNVANFDKLFHLTSKYQIETTFKSAQDVERVYIVIPDVVYAKKPNGAVASSRKIKFVVSFPVAKDVEKELKYSVLLLGVAKNGTANVYVRCKGDNKSSVPEAKQVHYSVVDGKIVLGNITF